MADSVDYECIVVHFIKGTTNNKAQLLLQLRLRCRADLLSGEAVSRALRL